MDDLIAEFIAETREMLQALSGAVVAWEADPADAARLDEIFRFVHTVKGNSGFFDLPRLGQLSHAAEDALAEVRAGRRSADAELVNAVLAVIDRIGELVQALDAGEALASEDDEPLIAALGGRPVPAAVAEPPAAAAAEPRRGARSIRLSVDLLDRMMSGVSDAVLARNELARRLREAPRDVAVETAFERVSACIAEMRDSITRTRMQRIDSLFSVLPRMVRDLAAELGKQVQFEVDGGDVELDREMIEMIRDPLTHIVRNAIDHGIEAPAERRRAGKEKAGRLTVAARQSGNQILIEITDDGRGVDGEALARKAVAAGMLAPERAGLMSAESKAALVFLPGLSTAREVTAISGRGVGMDVVRANIERIGGVVDLDSRVGRGLRLIIRVPLTLTIIPALTVSAGGQVFALPRAAIDEILQAAGAAVRIEGLGEARIATVRGRRLPLLALAQLLGVEAAAGEGGGKLVVLKPAGGDPYALAVDAVHDHEELVVKPAAPAVMAAGLYAGTTLADDGRPILLLDPSGLASVAGLRFDPSDAEPAEAPQEAATASRQTTLLLFRSLCGSLRGLSVAAVERIDEVPPEAVRLSGGKPRVVLGGRIVPLAGCAEPPAGRLRVLRLTDGAAEIAYGFAEVVDIRAVALEATPAAAPGEVASVALIDGSQVELLDPYWLFACHADPAAAAEPPVCALSGGDPWIDNMLRPLVESLGYRVVAAAEGVEADVLIVGSDAPAATAPVAAEVVRLRAHPELAGENDNSIYRYDRAALIAALSRGAERRKGRG